MSEKEQHAITDGQILHVWDTHVGDPNAKYPFIDADKIEFARAVLYLAAHAPSIRRAMRDAG